MAVPGFGLIADEVRRSTLQILARDENSSGSGIVTASDLAVTNAHVAQSDSLRVRLWSGDVLKGHVERRDAARDLALVRVTGLTADPAPLRDSSTVRPGEIAIAVGNPLGFIGALSTGVVRALGRVPGLGPRDWLQADVRLAPGNSGGPLADAHGRIIGINTMIFNGLGLAVPSNTVQAFLSSRTPFRLGVVVRDVSLHNGTRGVMVLELEPNGPAERAALLPGDLIVGIDGTQVRTAFDLADGLALAGATVVVRFLRGGQPQVRQTVARSVVAAERAA